MRRPICLALSQPRPWPLRSPPLPPRPRRSGSSTSTTGRTTSIRRCIEDFTKETGIKVRYDTFDTNDTLETKLLAGKSGYDVVVPTGYFLERQIKAGIFQKLDKAKLPNLAQHVARDRPAARAIRSRQPIRRQLHVGHDRHRLQRQEGARACWAAMAGSTAGTSCSSRRMLAKFKDCGVHMLDSSDDIMPAALHYLGLDPNTLEGGRPAEGRRAHDEDPAIGAQVPLVRISQCARDRRDLSGGRLVRRHQAGAEARGGGQERRRDRLCDPEGRRANVVRQSGDPARRPERRPRRTRSSTICSGPRWRRRTRTSSPTPTAIWRARNSSTRRCSTTRPIYPDAATMSRLYTYQAHDAEDAAAHEPAVDPDQDRDAEHASLTASGGAATAIARGARAPSLRPRR